jgi:hypothetical protein
MVLGVELEAKPADQVDLRAASKVMAGYVGQRQ